MTFTANTRLRVYLAVNPKMRSPEWLVRRFAKTEFTVIITINKVAQHGRAEQCWTWALDPGTTHGCSLLSNPAGTMRVCCVEGEGSF